MVAFDAALVEAALADACVRVGGHAYSDSKDEGKLDKV